MNQKKFSLDQDSIKRGKDQLLKRRARNLCRKIEMNSPPALSTPPPPTPRLAPTMSQQSPPTQSPKKILKHLHLTNPLLKKATNEETIIPIRVNVIVPRALENPYQLAAQLIDSLLEQQLTSDTELARVPKMVIKNLTADIEENEKIVEPTTEATLRENFRVSEPERATETEATDTIAPDTTDVEMTSTVMRQFILFLWIMTLCAERLGLLLPTEAIVYLSTIIMTTLRKFIYYFVKKIFLQRDKSHFQK